jgi:hypothetical protein
LQSKIHVFTSIDEVGNLIDRGVDTLPIELGGLLDADEVAKEYIKHRYEAEGLEQDDEERAGSSA